MSQGGALHETGGGGGVTSVSGTLHRITVTGTTNVIVDIAVDYVGQSSITTLGTVTTGTWNASTITEIYGGTNQTTYVTGDILYASAANTLSKLPAATNGQVLTLASGIPSWATPAGGGVTSVSGTAGRITSTGGSTPVIDIDATYVGQTSITTLGSIATGTWNATTIAVNHGGTGTTSLTAHSLLLGQGTSAITALGAATNGQIPIGSTGNDPVLATITQGSGISISNGAGSITIASSISQGIVTINGDSGSVTGTTVTLTGGSTGLVCTGSSSTMTVGGTLVASNGGTGQSSYTTGDMLYASASNALSKLALGTINQTIRSNASTPVWLGQNAFIEVYDDFFWNNAGRWTNSGSGTGAGVSTSQNTNVTSSNNGVWAINTGTTTTGTARIQSYENSIITGGGQIFYEALVRLSALSDGTDTYTAYIGFSSNTSGGDATNGIYFRYTNGTNSGNWQGVCRSASSESVTNTSSAVTASAWMKVGFTVNAANTLVTFYVNGSSVGTVNSNIPTTFTGLNMYITKSAGTTSRTMYVDYLHYVNILTTPR
jgi:hypothetical protein